MNVMKAIFGIVGAETVWVVVGSVCMFVGETVGAPREPHLKVAFHVLRYLKNDLSQGIFMTKHADCTITAYCDSDWAACSDSRKSVSGYIMFLGDSPIGWKSKKQTTISLSSAEAEYRAIRKVVGELVWLERLLGELTESCFMCYVHQVTPLLIGNVYESICWNSHRI
uniref:Reverse transcriptase Ty1/copia-type domain-containing protein n=1 Tax=Solanum lycopersicum TaxID=4081 RepID=A0A3Q7H5P6_SOLLC